MGLERPPSRKELVTGFVIEVDPNAGLDGAAVDEPDIGAEGRILSQLGQPDRVAGAGRGFRRDTVEEEAEGAVSPRVEGA